MKHGIHIKTDAPQKGHVSEVADAIKIILVVAGSNHADQETTRTALNVLTKLTRIENVNISNCSLGDIHD